MSKDVYVVMNHNLSEVISSVIINQLNQLIKKNNTQLSKLNLPGDQNSALWRIYTVRANKKKHTEKSNYGTETKFSYSSGLNVHMFEKTLVIGSWVRWKEIVNDIETQKSFRQICSEFARVFKSSKAIYIPDSGSFTGEKVIDMAFEGISFEELEVFIKRINKPLSFGINFEDFDSKDEYFIDHF